MRIADDPVRARRIPRTLPTEETLMVIEFDPRQSRAAIEACAPDPVLSEAIVKALETTRRHWRLTGGEDLVPDDEAGGGHAAMR
jgi:hypothetical protein